jgi:hypothetical protein
MELHLDTSAALASRVGRAGLGARALAAWGPAVGRAHGEWLEAVAAGLVPGFGPAGALPPLTVASGARRIAVLGDSGAVEAACCLADDGAVLQIGGAGLGGWPAFAAGRGRPGLVVLDGPAWVRGVGRALAPACARVELWRGDGAEPRPAEPGWGLVDADGAADLRFSAWSPLALALAARAGADAAALEGARGAVAALLRSPAWRSNPAMSLAAAALALAQESGRSRWVFVGATDGAHAVASVLARAWTAIGARRAESDGPAGPPWASAAAVEPGDEGAWAGVCAPDGDAVVLVFGPESSAGDGVALGALGSAAALRRGLLQADCALLAAEGVPVLRLHTGEDGPAGRMAAAMAVGTAALLAAAARGLDPLALPAADALRVLQGEAGLDKPA